MYKEKKLMALFVFLSVLTLSASAITIDGYDTSTSWFDLDGNGYDEPYLDANISFSNVNMSEDTADVRFYEVSSGDSIRQLDRSIGDWRVFISSPSMSLQDGNTYYVNVTAEDVSQNTKDTLDFVYKYNVSNDTNANDLTEFCPDGTPLDGNESFDNATVGEAEQTFTQSLSNVFFGENECGQTRSLTGIISNSISDAVNTIKAFLLSITASLINSLSVIGGFLTNAFNWSAWVSGNWALEAKGVTWDTNESFTYYNYTGDYPKRINDTNVEALDVMLNRYDINITLNANQYYQESDLGLLDDPDPVYTLGTVQDREYTINSYTHEFAYLPEGVGGLSLSLNRISAIASIFIYGVISILPDPFVNFVNLFVEQVGTLAQAVAILVKYLFGAIDFALNEGTLLIIGGLKAYLFLVFAYYGDIVNKLYNKRISLGKASQLMVRDIENKFTNFIHLVGYVWGFVESGFNTIINLLRFIRSLIPFI